jgi:hypothetical protein
MNLYRNNRNKQNCFVTEINRNKPKISEKYPNILSFKLFGWVFCLFLFNRNIETLCFGIEAKQPKLTVLKQTEKTEKTGKKLKTEEKNEKNERKNKQNRENTKFPVKNSKICFLSNWFSWFSVCFGSIETSKLFVSVLKRNNRNKRVVSDSAETSFCSSFGSLESKLVSKDTLPVTERR